MLRKHSVNGGRISSDLTREGNVVDDALNVFKAHTNVPVGWTVHSVEIDLRY